MWRGSLWGFNKVSMLLCSSRGGRQAAIWKACGLLGNRCHHVHTVSHDVKHKAFLFWRSFEVNEWHIESFWSVLVFWLILDCMLCDYVIGPFKYVFWLLMILFPSLLQAVRQPSFLWWNRRRWLWKPWQEPVPKDPGGRLWVWLSILGWHLWFR